MNILKNSKIPEFKIPKFKFENLSEFENIKIKFNKENISLKEKYSKRKYKRTNYKTVKEIFENSTRLYKDKEFILENFNGEKFEEISYGKFRDDVISLGTALTNKLNLKKERIAIIGENTYEWYVSYMSLLSYKEVGFLHMCQIYRHRQNHLPRSCHYLLRMHNQHNIGHQCHILLYQC